MANIEVKNPKQYPMSLLQINLLSSLNLFLQGASGREKLDFIYFIIAATKEIDPITHNNILVGESGVSFAKKKQPKE